MTYIWALHIQLLIIYQLPAHNTTCWNPSSVDWYVAKTKKCICNTGFRKLGWKCESASRKVIEHKALKKFSFWRDYLYFCSTLSLVDIIKRHCSFFHLIYRVELSPSRTRHSVSFLDNMTYFISCYHKLVNFLWLESNCLVESHALGD